MQIKQNLTYEDYKDKIMGCWLGKSLGGLIGSPYESHKIFGLIEPESCWPKIIYPNDDLDIQIVWLEMMEELGPYFDSSDMARYWQDRCWYNFSEYGFFLYNYQKSIAPPYSGWYNNNFYKESMGCPIRSEIWSLVSPGNPKLAANLAYYDAVLDHSDNSLYAEQFWAAAGAYAFFAEDTNNFEAVFEAGRSVVPEECDIYLLSLEIPNIHSNSKNLEAAWRKIIRKYGHRDVTNVSLNFALTILSLLEGNGDFKKTICAALSCGFDADCTAATAGGLLGILKGSKLLPGDWTEKMGDTLTCGIEVKHKEATFNELTNDTLLVGIEVSKALNSKTEIKDIPKEVISIVNRRIQHRIPANTIHIKAVYPNGPDLKVFGVSYISLELSNLGGNTQCGTVEICSPLGISVNPCSANITIKPGETVHIPLEVKVMNNMHAIYDKNIFNVSFSPESGNKLHYDFGLSGSRVWQVYGPYWDAWDTVKYPVCPFRNDDIIDKAHKQRDCLIYARHNGVNLDRKYIDESIMLKQDIPEEQPFIIDSGEDLIVSSTLGGFCGEACYYLTRDIVSSEVINCAVSIGCTCPFILWVDGKEILRSDTGMTWSPVYDYMAMVKLDDRPKRFVIKLVNDRDSLEFSLCFMKNRGEKIRGVSFLVDTTGTALPSNIKY